MRHRLSFQAVLFDLDGTLLDTLTDLADAMNRTLEQFGFPTHPVDAYRYFVGEGSSMLAYRALPDKHRTEMLVTELHDAFIEDYARNWAVATQPYSGIPELLTALVHQQVPCGVVSNKPHVFTDACVRHYLDPQQFSLVYGHLEGMPHKPDPAMALQAARVLNLDPATILFVGDTAIDMQTAVAAGMHGVGASWGFRPTEELLEAGAKTIVQHPREILSLLNDASSP